ncbi:MAG: hypothetical protein COA79_08605 [Planctomycetota bacterium]|nr:MAG: hypothetical protein COA79_08605 [Planctomycetota bacterium]
MSTNISDKPEVIEEDHKISFIIVALVTFIFLMPFTSFFTVFKIEDLYILFLSYFIRMFAITAGYHRYFSHTTFKTSRIFQFFLAATASTTLQGGPLWWSTKHRHHHAKSDLAEDYHSPVQHGFWHSHMLWFMYKKNLNIKMDSVMVKFNKFPEIRFIEKYWAFVTLLMIAILYFFGGWNWVIWGFCVPAVLLNHATYTVNSLVHIFGYRRYETSDNSKNNWFVAIITLGEGWHNNHHKFSNCTRQGFAWYEFDITYYILKLLSYLRIVWDIKPVPERVLKEGNIS